MDSESDHTRFGNPDSVKRRHALGLGKLSRLEPKTPAIRYEQSAPGEMIHIDIKKLGRFQVEGHRVTCSRQAGSSRGAGRDFLHVCVDDASRLAYTEILPRA